jgi:hypothetical protein
MMGERMPFDGASWKRWDEDPEWRRDQRLCRLLRIMVGVTAFGTFVLMLWH